MRSRFLRVVLGLTYKSLFELKPWEKKRTRNFSSETYSSPSLKSILTINFKSDLLTTEQVNKKYIEFIESGQELKLIEKCLNDPRIDKNRQFQYGIDFKTKKPLRGYTPLMFSLLTGNNELALLLIRNKADISINVDDKTAFSIALDNYDQIDAQVMHELIRHQKYSTTYDTKIQTTIMKLGKMPKLPTEKICSLLELPLIALVILPIIPRIIEEKNEQLFSLIFHKLHPVIPIFNPYTPGEDKTLLHLILENATESMVETVRRVYELDTEKPIIGHFSRLVLERNKNQSLSSQKTTSACYDFHSN
jgi:hypothetical protein